MPARSPWKLLVIVVAVLFARPPLAGGSDPGGASDIDAGPADPGGGSVELGSGNIDYLHQVRPILRQHCYRCHGAERDRGGLRLDIKSEAFRGGDFFGPSIVAGDAEDSPLVQFVADPEADLQMPPEQRLSESEIAILVRWVNEGAVWPDGVDLAEREDRRDHWAFKPLAKVMPPLPSLGTPSADTPPADATGTAAAAHEGWGRGAIDAFVLAGLHQAGLQPAAPAAPVDWLRRVTLNLTGLPPTPEQAADFLHDLQQQVDPQAAYAAVVQRLLDSPRYGERWAQHWLDVVRYADTHGFEVNTERPNAWPYRDYVIDAFNRDTPYDQFVREQIVGDALGQDAATGFLVTASVLLPAQIGADEPSKRLARQDAIDEIVVNIGQTFLGLSVGCARCHDHKFDPISHADYFGMQALVAGVEYGERELATAGTAMPGPAVGFVGRFRQPDTIHRLLRGDPELPREEIAPAVIQSLGDVALTAQASDQARRQALADWLVQADHPLTARVMVNRIWQAHFGTGIVATPSDLGRSGMPPSHPELLDWLAGEFIRSGWSVKHMQRLITLSATYRQLSDHDPAAAAIDAEARLLWRFPPRRLTAEELRDSMLAASGRLNLEMGGPGFNLFDKRGGLSGFRPVESYQGDGLRRMIYAHKVRRERDAVFGAFDSPDGGQSAARRAESTTPIQALNLFNSRFTLEESAALATRIQYEVGSDPSAQLQQAWMIVLGRQPTPDESELAKPLVQQHGLTMLCRVLFNCNEFLFLP